MSGTVDHAPASARDRDVSLRDVARGSAINLVGGVSSAGSTFVLAFALASYLPTADVGIFFAATSLFLLVSTLGQLGTSVGLVYFIARDQRSTGGMLRERYLRVAMAPVLIVAGLTLVVLLLAAPTLAGWMGAGEPQLVDSLRMMAVFVIPAAVLNVFTSASRGLGTMMPTALFDNIVRALLQVVLVLAVAPLEVVSLTVLAWCVPYVPCALAVVDWWRRRPSSPSSGGSSAAAVTGEFWRFTAPRALAGVAQMAMQRLDVVLVGALAGLPEAAIYAVATRFHVVGQLPGQALSRATQPRLAAALLGEERHEASRLYQVATCWLILVVWPFYLTLMLASAHLLRIFGEDYVEGAQVLALLSASMLVATGCGMVDNVLIMGGKTSWNLYNVLLAFGVNLVLDLVLIPRLGIMGAAIGWSAAILCANLVPLAQVAAALRLHPFGNGTLTAMTVTLLCFAGLPGLAVLVLGNELSVLLPVLLVALILHGAAVWVLRSRLHVHLPSPVGRLGRNHR